MQATTKINLYQTHAKIKELQKSFREIFLDKIYYKNMSKSDWILKEKYQKIFDELLDDFKNDFKLDN